METGFEVGKPMIARAISHDARLPILAHVDELRTRLIVSAVVLAVAFAFAFWQNHGVLNVLNRPLANATSGALKRSHGPLAEAARTQQAVRVALNRQRVAFEQMARASSGRPPAERRALTAAAQADGFGEIAVGDLCVREFIFCSIVGLHLPNTVSLWSHGHSERHSGGLLPPISDE